VSVGPLKILLHLLSLLTFHTYCPSWVKFIPRDLRVILLRSCHFFEIGVGKVYLPYERKLNHIFSCAGHNMKF